MSEINTGGPAFPTENEHQSGNSTWHHEGMTLRDYFAAKSDIPWEVAAAIVYRQNGNSNGTTTQIMRKRSQLRFEQADEMLHERQS